MAERWARAERRYAAMLERWPRLAGRLAIYFDVLADYAEEDFRRLLSILQWPETNPDASLYLHQLPVESVDTKWLSARKSLVGSLLLAIRNDAREDKDFYLLTGIRREPANPY